MSTSKYYRFPLPESHDKKIRAILERQKKKESASTGQETTGDTPDRQLPDKEGPA